MPTTFQRISEILEYGAVLLSGRLLGIDRVVRYLRNPNPRVTVPLLRAFGAHVGRRTTIKRALHLDNVSEDANSAGTFRHLRIGDNCYIGDDVFFDLANEIHIQDGVVLSAGVAVLTHADCNRSPVLALQHPRVCAPVVVGAGAWLCARATVLAGVTVAERSVVAAHALLRSNTLPNGVYGGVPARLLERSSGARLLKVRSPEV